MKKVLITLVVILTTTIAFAQNSSQDVLYLKDGSIIKGIIIEQIPNESFKIQTADGNIFEYQMFEVEKFAKNDSQTQKQQANPPSTSGDVIIKRNGDEINAKVTEIGKDDVKYKKFDNQDGPTYTILKSEIFMIRYANGKIELCNNNYVPEKKGRTNTQKTSNIDFKKNQFGLDLGVGGELGYGMFGTYIGFRYLHNYSQYFGVNFVDGNIATIVSFDDESYVNISYTPGVRGYTARFGRNNNMFVYGSFKLGPTLLVDVYYGDVYATLHLSPEVGIHLSKKFFLGLAYHYIYGLEAHYVALRIGWDF